MYGGQFLISTLSASHLARKLTASPSNKVLQVQDDPAAFRFCVEQTF